MPRYEGFIATLKKDGKAEVVIQPGSMGIPGASPQVNRRVCHCTTDGSTITIEALNSVGAGVGDRVFVSRDASALIKNAAVLLGIPAMGLIVGVAIAAILTHSFTSHIIGGSLIISACLVLGIVLGVSVFRRGSAGSLPVIEHIIEKRRQGDSLFSDNQYFSDESNRGCGTCAGPFSQGPALDRNGHAL